MLLSTLDYLYTGLKIIIKINKTIVGDNNGMYMYFIQKKIILMAIHKITLYNLKGMKYEDDKDTERVREGGRERERGLEIYST